MRYALIVWPLHVQVASTSSLTTLYLFTIVYTNTQHLSSSLIGGHGFEW